ncbi:hypothetical protein E5S54_26470 [Escherichia coli]|nr:hypothetical protein [Escherichia coli]EEY5752680.1 hypothetical protein [Escherichia coli]EFD0675461.1 hypothetical protein [Escherichia coli]EFN5655967.1 hypothetical protein [Escherichia coli]EFN7972598.1 hypothetical protein [Escherichia coli]
MGTYVTNTGLMATYGGQFTLTIVTARAPDGKTARVVIETMGYEDSDYCARKSRQHTGMKQIGVLHTDPPKWLDNDHPPFKKHMYGVFMHLRY